MTHDLPIVPDADFRRSHRFPDLDRIENLDLEPSLARFDEAISGRGGIGDVAQARSVMTDPGKSGLLDIHRVLFHPRPGAGQLRQSSRTCNVQWAGLSGTGIYRSGSRQL